MFAVEVKGLERLVSTLNAMEAEARNQESELAKQMAVTLSMDTVSNITTQAFGNFGHPYSENYAEWKQKEVGHLDFWKLFGDLIVHISAFKSPTEVNAWESGILPGARNSEGKLVEMYAGVNEAYDGNNRPLFGRSRIIFKNEKWPVMGRNAQARIVSKWTK